MTRTQQDLRWRVNHWRMFYLLIIVIGGTILKKELIVIGTHFDADESVLNSVCDADYAARDPLTHIMLKITRAISSSSTDVTGEQLTEIRTNYLAY